jgi:hypothetical protein
MGLPVNFARFSEPPKVTFYTSSDSGFPPTQEVDDENHQRHHKQQMDQAAGHMETKAEKP